MSADDDRQARLAAALRANLRRRKGRPAATRPPDEKAAASSPDARAADGEATQAEPQDTGPSADPA